MKTWKLEDARNRFSEVVRRAMGDEPQLVTRSGREAVVVLAVDEYRRLTSARNLVEFIQGSPFAEAVASGDLDLARSSDTGRDVAL